MNRPLTVAALIRRLQDQPQDATVYIESYDGTTGPAANVRVATPNEGYWHPNAVLVTFAYEYEPEHK